MMTTRQYPLVMHLTDKLEHAPVPSNSTDVTSQFLVMRNKINDGRNAN
jgi:hypothetical protein